MIGAATDQMLPRRIGLPAPSRDRRALAARLLPRAIGTALIAGSLATTLVHRAVYEAAKHGPAQLAEFALALASFLLAAAGILLVTQGDRLFKPGCCLRVSRRRLSTRSRPRWRNGTSLMTASVEA